MILDDKIDQIRSQYDILKYNVYFMSAAIGPAGHYWLNPVKDYFEGLRLGHREPGLTVHRNRERFARQGNAKLIQADEDEVTNSYRVMAAANFVINNLVQFEKGDNVVFSDLTYPSISYILLGLRQRGVELRRIENINGEVPLSEFEKVVDHNTKLVCVCRTTPWCGFTQNVKKLCEIAHAHNAYVFDDAMQAVGVTEIDVHDDDVDFLVSGSYKWQCGPEGAGLLYVRRDLIERLDGGYSNYLSAQYPGTCPILGVDGHDNISHWDYPPANTADKYNLGQCTGEALLGWEATLVFLHGLGIANIASRVSELGGYLIAQLEQAGCKVLTPVDVNKRHGLIVYTNGSLDKDREVTEALTMANPKPIRVSTCSLGGIEGIRVATNFFNTKEDIDTLVAAQKSFNETGKC
jgi:cysteine desulfurase / selenocysteine lyase